MNVLEGRSAGPLLTAWMVHHAAQVICACMVGVDGLTPFRRLKERKFGTPPAAFGERVWLRDPALERVNKFNPRCTEARLLGFCLKSSRYIVVDFDGRFRMVRTIKRANADDRWKVVSPKDPFSTAYFGTPAEFTCSRGTRGEVHPAAERLERHPVAQSGSQPCSDGTSDRCPGCRALVSGGRAQGHTEECRIRVEGQLRKTEEGKARLRAAASRVGDAPTGRALKRVRFAADQVEDDAETPEATSVSAPSSLPAEAAMSNSLAPSSEPGLSASADDASDDKSNSQSATKRLHIDHSTRDVVVLLDGSDVGHAVEQCRTVCHGKGTFFVDVNDWDCKSRDSLRTIGSDGTNVACSSGETTRELVSNESRLLDVLAAARNRNGDWKTTVKCVRQHKCGVLGAVGNCEEFDPVWFIVLRWKKDFIDKMGVYDVVP